MIARLYRWPWLLLALIAYYLPWVYHQAAALTFNANDLAEWNTLADGARTGTIPLLVPFLLRVVLAFLALLVGLHAANAKTRLSRWGFAALAIILSMTLLPPVDFFKGAWDDINYRQQLGIALATGIGLVVTVVAQYRGLLERYQRRLWLALLLVTAVCAIVGNIMALNTVRSYQLNASVGGGIFVLAICLGMLVIARE